MVCHPILLALNSQLMPGPSRDAVAQERGGVCGRDLIPIVVAAVTDRCGFILEEHGALRDVSVERRAMGAGSRAVLRMTCGDGEGEIVGALEVTALLVDDTERVLRIEGARLCGGAEMVWVLGAPRGWRWREVQMLWVTVVVG